VPLIPFYIFYSMFGFQRTGDQFWALADERGRGFVMGATAGRTTLMGEGLQHDDGHSHVLASVIPNIRAYDPAYAYELASIVREGIDRMYAKGEDVFYYITLYNENYSMPKRPDDLTDEQISRGIYRLLEAPSWARRPGSRARRSGWSAAARSCSRSSPLGASSPSAAFRPRSTAPLPSSSSARRRPGDRSLEPAPPGKKPRVPHVAEVLPPDGGQIVIATDWIRTYPDLVAPVAAGLADRPGHGRLRPVRHRETLRGSSRSTRRTSPRRPVDPEAPDPLSL
jgi:pyruvate dehydrogenase E1 component